VDPREAKCLAEIEKYGCHVIHVLEEDGLPPFTYSVGIQQSTGAPEAVVVGLKRELAHSVINNYHRRVREQGALAAGRLHSDFIEGFDCLLQKVHPKHYEEYFGWDIWLYKGDGFEVAKR
jgi:hypothetical protein